MVVRVIGYVILAAELTWSACGADSVAAPADALGFDVASAETVGSDANGDAAGDTMAPEAVATPLRPWIDTHLHPTGVHSDCTTQACIDASLATMDRVGMRKALLIHPPAVSGSSEREAIAPGAAALAPGRFFYGVGGSQLNAMLQSAPEPGSPSSALEKSFGETFERLVTAGGPVVIGEIATLHLSYEPAHPFEETLANSPLFLKLADLAASAGVAIDLHMDVALETMATPAFFTELSDNNPDRIQGNVAALEAMLAHNRNARIVLAHVGRDTTGDMSAALIDRLLGAHANLSIQLHPINGPLHTATAILDPQALIRPEWLALLEKHPTRVVLGSDVFLDGSAQNLELLGRLQRFLQSLPADLAYAIGCTNPVAIYGLPSGC